jgi:hypothetical protein
MLTSAKPPLGGLGGFGERMLVNMSGKSKGNPQLRRELDTASRMTVVNEYNAKLAALKVDPGHSITVLPDGRGRISRFNCFAYAFGVWSHPDFIALVDQADDSAIMDSAFVCWMIEDGLLTEVQSQDVRTGDIAIYRSNSAITHAALIVAKEEPMALHSKWGGNEVHRHGLWEIMASYGNEVRFFRPLESGIILKRLGAYAGSERDE